MNIIRESTALAHPSLALIKYWGKKDSKLNLPATASLAVTLGNLTTRTTVRLIETETLSTPSDMGDKVYINEVLQPSDRFSLFFSDFRRLVSEKGSTVVPKNYRILARSSSDFPTAAGFASSAGGFAALASACADAAGIDSTSLELSSLARIGSASAARSFWGGFTFLEAGAAHAEPLYDESWWPQFRTIVLEVERGPKGLSSRLAMETTRETSPYYQSWIDDAPQLFSKALEAMKHRDLDVLGPLIRLSYMRMFGSMFAADPPIVYWKPGSIAAIHLCEAMRREGMSVWETMDAGPQVKLFCQANSVPEILSVLKTELPEIPFRVCPVGAAPEIIPKHQQ